MWQSVFQSKSYYFQTKWMSKFLWLASTWIVVLLLLHLLTTCSSCILLPTQQKVHRLVTECIIAPSISAKRDLLEISVASPATLPASAQQGAIRSRLCCSPQKFKRGFQRQRHISDHYPHILADTDASCSRVPHSCHAESGPCVCLSRGVSCSMWACPPATASPRWMLPCRGCPPTRASERRTARGRSTWWSPIASASMDPLWARWAKWGGWGGGLSCVAAFFLVTAT